MTEQNAETIFGQAIEIQSDEERAAFLNEACGEDQRLRTEVEKLVADHFRAGSFLEQPAINGDATAAMPPGMEQVGSHIGPYKLRERLGEGGMGVVWAAEQKQPLRRKVALKVIKPGMDTEQVIARFEAEREALALMDHPNIARVLDAGTTEQGRPYFVMELICGVPITEYCDTNKLSVHERLDLFMQVCRAVQHAHQNGIIHRDIKPSNVLVTLHDDKPIPKVIDFGVAKALRQPLTDLSIYTGLFQAIGTLPYMSPEQAQLSGLRVDTRADIYGLGVLLYELLTGSTPFDKEELESAALDEAFRMIREQEPPKPSTKFSSMGDRSVAISQNRKASVADLGKAIRGDLDWIVMKALDKDRSRRYETASGFAADVKRFLCHEMIEARAPSPTYRIRKWVRRNRLLTGVGVVSAVALIGFAYMTVMIFLQQATIKRQITELAVAALSDLAAEQASNGESKAAVESYEKLIELQESTFGAGDPRVFKTKEKIAYVLAESDDFHESVPVLRELYNRYSQQLGTNHQETSEVAKRLCRASIRTAQGLLKEERDYMQAKKHAETAVELSKYSGAIDAGSAFACLTESQCRLREFSEAHETAVDWLRLKNNSHLYPTYLFLAIVNHHLERPRLAEDWFYAASELWPGASTDDKLRWQSFRDRAIMLIFGPEHSVLPSLATEKQVELYTRLSNSYPDAGTILRYRGYCLIQLGRWNEALDDFRLAAHRNPDDRLYYHASHALVSGYLGHEEESSLAAQRLLDTRDRSTSERNPYEENTTILIVCLLTGAESNYEAIYSLAGDLALAKGIAAYRCGRFREAIPLLREVDDNSWRYALAQCFEGMAHARLGDHRSASQKLKIARKLVDEQSPMPGKAKEAPHVSYYTSVIWCEVLLALREAESLEIKVDDESDSNQ